MLVFTNSTMNTNSILQDFDVAYFSNTWEKSNDLNRCLWVLKRAIPDS